MNIIEIKNLNVWFGNNLVLDNINLTIDEKEFLGIIGPNGGGKTTLLKVMLGLIKPDEGEVLIFGKRPKLSRQMIGYVPQYSSFESGFPISVWDVVLMGRLGKKKLFGKLDDEDKDFVRDAISKVNLSGYENKIVGNLSGGEKQRVLIARALAINPKLLLLDEPTASIDSSLDHNFYDLLTQLNKEKTIILISHDIGAISQNVKKIACMNRKLVFHNSKEVSKEMLEKTYHCPVDLIAHGVPHRVLDIHEAKRD